MNNIQKIASMIAQGAKNLVIHKIPKSRTWVVGQKTGNGKWRMTVCYPDKNKSIFLGEMNDEEHLILWENMTIEEIEAKIKQKQHD